MTAQIPEMLRFRGEDHPMCTEPLAGFLARRGKGFRFEATCSALWRGYVGSWAIVDDRLHLVDISGTLTDGTPATLAMLFPDAPHPVFARWYTGQIRLPQGRLLDYVHGGYGSTYERDVLLDVVRGVVKSIQVRHNGLAKDDDAPEGYSVAAMSVFPPGS